MDHVFMSLLTSLIRYSSHRKTIIASVCAVSTCGVISLLWFYLMVIFESGDWARVENAVWGRMGCPGLG